jgi:hypothetical protein
VAVAGSSPSAARTVAVAVRLTEAEAAEIDAARGAVDRRTWVREAALAAARPAPRRSPKNCKHEGMRLHRGWCPDCESLAVKK